MSTTQQPQTDFVKAISRLDATALVVGSMIGSGIFIVSAEILRQVHAPGLLLVVWAVSGVVTLMGAITYGELAAMFPRAGGQYVYLREGISPLFGYLYGWTLFLVIQTGTIAAVAVAFARFTSVFWPGLSPDVFLGFTMHFPKPIGDIAVGLSPQRILAVLSVALLTWINVRGVRTAALIQTSLTAIKTSVLALLILLGITIGRNAEALAANFAGNFWATGGAAVGLGAIGAAMVGSLFSMDAWNNVGFAGSELKNAQRDLPLAMGAGVLIVTVLYVLANVAYLNVLPAAAIASAPQDRVGTAALEAILGEPGLKLMAAAIMISTFGCNNGLILSGARVYYAMARDDLFFRSAGVLHPRFKTPAVALVVQGLWTSLLCLSGTYTQLLNFVIFAALLFYGLTAVGLFALRAKRPAAERPVRAPGYPWLPALYVIARTGGRADSRTVKATQLPLLQSDRQPVRLSVLDQRLRGTTFVSLEAKSVLNSPQQTGVDFWSLNPYIGCEFGCTYCYARYAHRYTVERAHDGGRLSDAEFHEFRGPHGWEAFEKRVFVKERLLGVLEGDLRRYFRSVGPTDRPPAPIVIGTATDPYQPAERRFRLTRGVLERLARCEGLNIGIITKSPLIARDTDV